MLSDDLIKSHKELKSRDLPIFKEFQAQHQNMTDKFSALEAEKKGLFASIQKLQAQNEALKERFSLILDKF